MLFKIQESLKKENIFPRRYFYPSLNELPYLEDKQNISKSESILRRVLCLPTYTELDVKEQMYIIKIIKTTLS